MFFLLESAGILLGIFMAWLYAKQAPRPAWFLFQAALVSASAWMAEESCIRWYRLYEYHPSWYFFVDAVPLLVIIIWPVIIASAMDLTSGFDNVLGRLKILAGAAVVAADALLIEPLSASAGLWLWRLPGIFGVPPIGILGWFFFALLTMLIFKNVCLQKKRLAFSLLLLFLPAAGTHLLLLLSWWGLLRWINFPMPALAATGAAWLVSFVMVGVIHKSQAGRRICKRTLLLRLPAALFFFALILQPGQVSPLLPAYALAFVPPYATMMIQQYRRHNRVT